jgi:hypothetical protein
MNACGGVLLTMIYEEVVIYTGIEVYVPEKFDLENMHTKNYLFCPMEIAMERFLGSGQPFL